MAKKTSTKKKESSPKSSVVSSQKAVANHFDVSTRTVNDWLNRPDPMPGKKGSYDLVAIEKWRADNFAKGKDQQFVEAPDAAAVESKETKSKKKNSGGESLSQTYLIEKIRKERALADQNEIKATRMDEEYIPISDLLQWVTAFLTLQRKLLTAMPVEMFADAPDNMRKIYQPDLKARIDIYLNQMGDWVERVEDLRQ